MFYNKVSSCFLFLVFVLLLILVISLSVFVSSTDDWRPTIGENSMSLFGASMEELDLSPEFQYNGTGSAIGGRFSDPVVPDATDMNRGFFFFFDRTDWSGPSSLCLRPFSISSGKLKWIGEKFCFDNEIYVVDATYPGGGLYEIHIAVSANIDNDNRTIFTFGGHYSANAPLKFVRSNVVINFDNYNNPDSWSLPITVHNITNGGAYHRLFSLGNVLFISDNPANWNKMSVLWSYDNGGTWNNRDYADGEAYGVRQVFYDEENGKWLHLAAFKKGHGVRWSTNNVKFFYATSIDLIENVGVRSSDMGYDNEIPENLLLPVSDTDIDGMDDIVEFNSPYDSYYDSESDMFYILVGNVSRDSGRLEADSPLYLLHKKRGSSEDWETTQITDFNCYGKSFMGVYDGNFISLCILAKGGEQRMLYAVTRNPTLPQSYVWKEFTPRTVSFDTYDGEDGFKVIGIYPNKFDERIIYTFGAVENHDGGNPSGKVTTYSWVDFIDNREKNSGALMSN